MNADIHTVFSAGDCPSHEQLLAYNKGELSGEARNRIEHHLSECEMCSDELGGLAKMKDTGRLPEIVDGIRAELKARQARIIGINRPVFYASAAAILVLLLGALFLLQVIVPMRHSENAIAKTEETLLQVPPKTPAPPPPASASSEKPLLAVAERPGKAAKKAEQETMVTETTADIAEYEAPPAMEKPAEQAPVIIPKKDSVITTRSLGYAAEPAAAIADEKMAMVKSQSSSQIKFDMGSTAMRKEASLVVDSAMNLYQESNYREASVLFEKKLQADPSNSSARYYLSDCLYRIKDYTKAKEELEKILADPNDPYYSKAVRLMRRVKSEEMK
jgi:hypothetical protein